MLNWIDMAIIDMCRIIRIIPNYMLPKAALPKAALPNSPLTEGNTHSRSSFRNRQCFRKPLFDDSPTVGIAIITNRQCPYAMQMFEQEHPGINMKRPTFTGFLNN